MKTQKLAPNLEFIKNNTILVKTSQRSTLKGKSKELPILKAWVCWTQEQFETQLIPLLITQDFNLSDQQLKEYQQNTAANLKILTAQSEIWVLRPYLWGAKESSQGSLGFLKGSDYIQIRECAGQFFSLISEGSQSRTLMEVGASEPKQIEALALGLEMSSYQYKKIQKQKKFTFDIQIAGHPSRGPTEAELQKWILKGRQKAQSVNLARHFTNLPPNILNPVSFANALKGLFSATSKVKTEVWGPQRLKNENMNLILTVGAASPTPPQLVVVRYRPKGFTKKAEKPKFALVGKGITFDTGGVNLKPDSGMRLMKKDMGGAAAVAGIANWVIESEYKWPCDFYFPLAENSIGSGAFRPSDVVTSRAGLDVEIHNTDAEGRLVLADAMALAVESKPEVLIDVATLTGAIKSSLGTQVAGLFGNNDACVQSLLKSSQYTGDWLWPMPLFRKYKSSMKSQFADMTNASDGFGGAVTAALFLENFVGETSWMHLDIYAWKDSAEGAVSESGASGQSVQAIMDWLERA